MRNPFSLIKEMDEGVSDFFFPNLCKVCQETPIAFGDNNFCISCHRDLAMTNHFEIADNSLMYKFYGRLKVERAFALLFFTEGGTVQKAVHNFKYKGNTEIGVQFGKMIGDKMIKENLHKGIDLLMPVPIHDSKKIKRGFNQSEFLAEGIHIETNLPIVNDVLVKAIANASQTKKSRMERVLNVADVFDVKNVDLIKGRHVLLIDDVITTGSTLDACGNALFKHGVGKISIASLAMAYTGPVGL